MFQVKKKQVFNLKSIPIAMSAVCVLGLFVAGKHPAIDANNTIESASFAPNESAMPPLGKLTVEASDVSQLVTDATAFYNSLSTTQQASLQKDYTTTLARKWSNLPCGSTCRNGVQLGSLSAAQLVLAKKVIEDALGTTANNGFQEYNDITTAEDYLGATGGSTTQYNSGLRWLAFLNAPTTTGAWMLQFGGHHYAANLAFNNGHVIGTTPFFVALEPTTFTYNGTYYEPMEDERDALRAMLASLSTSELTTAKLTTTFSDCLMSPGESNGNTNTFPTTKQGLAVSGLSTAQKELVLAAIRNYVEDVDATTAEAIMARYTDELNETYIAYTGNGTSGSATSFLTSNSNYVRIDGPTVWIEFACQNGVVISNQIHYHSVWRDHEHDYGVDLSGAAIDETSTATGDIAVSYHATVYPNPANSQITISLPKEVVNARIMVIDMTGNVVVSQQLSGQTLSIDMPSLPKGSYIVKVQDKTNRYTGKFVRN